MLAIKEKILICFGILFVFVKLSDENFFEKDTYHYEKQKVEDGTKTKEEMFISFSNKLSEEERQNGVFIGDVYLNESKEFLKNVESDETNNKIDDECFVCNKISNDYDNGYMKQKKRLFEERPVFYDLEKEQINLQEPKIIKVNIEKKEEEFETVPKYWQNGHPQKNDSLLIKERFSSK